MRVLLVAPPGAGKGTQGALIASHFKIPHIAIGDLLRDNVAKGTELGRKVQGYLDRGDLVPDEIVMGLLRERLAAAKANGTGYVLDGIPRTLDQAKAAYVAAKEINMTVNVALHLQADDEEVTRRLLARARRDHRSDDTAEVIRQRLALYRTATLPVLEWYAQRGVLVSVDAMRPADQVGREILAALEAMAPLVDLVPEDRRRSVDLTDLGEWLDQYHNGKS
ncbi:adenylate kinase [Dactylosporangium sucinum]|uniref:Adenylate kinase n=1 Tax=Dactylosporangium sucinum TaxID=1424081 RepID=A0A917X8A2_9ACTN|nr:adenylate kinase [Dactylosporangium sucinum]GGM88483.1 adenylate kinase [Dactylosporangium sucinum]